MTTVPVTTQDRIPMPIPIGARPGGPPGGPAAAGAMSVGDIVRILKQRIFLIIFCFIFFTGATVGATFYLIKEHPRYRSSSSVLVESPFPRQPMQFVERSVTGDLMDRFVADQMFLARDEMLLREVLNDADVRSTQWYQSEPDKNLLLDELKSELGISQIPDSSFFVVAFATKVREDAPKIVNTIIEYYLNKVQAMSREQYSAELGEYKKRQTELRRTLQQVRDQKETFITSQLAVPGLTAGVNVVGEMWRALSVEAAQLEMEQLQLKAAFDNLKGLDPEDVTISPEMMLMIESDPQIASLNGTLLQLRQEQLAVLQKVGPNHQTVQSLDAQIASIQQLIDDVMAEKLDQAREYQISSAENSWLNALQAQLQLQERVDQAKAEQRDADRKLAQYRALEDEQILLEDQYSAITDYINQLELVVRDREMVRVRSISQAVPALKRSFPQWKINLPIGGMLGLSIGVGLALLLEVIDTSVKTTRDITRHIHIPILGTVPDLDDEELPIDQIELATHTAPRSLTAEAFRSIRTNLLLTSPAERQRALLITSAKPEEGKTAVAINLGISLAQNNRRVLLIDANFHRPALKTFFPRVGDEGLSSVLVGRASLDDVVTSTDLPNLDVIGSGPIPPNPAELLAGSYLGELIQQAAERYDQVLFDGPPVLLVSDSLVLAGQLDGVILVCRAKLTSRGVIVRGRERLENANIRVFGGVLNGAQVTRGGYFREQIRSYYDYQPGESLASTEQWALPADQRGRSSGDGVGDGVGEDAGDSPKGRDDGDADSGGTDRGKDDGKDGGPEFGKL